MGAAETPSYEDIRKQRVEANNRRMEELGLKDMSKSMTKSFVESKVVSTIRKFKPHNVERNTSIILRRSSRVATTPQPDYREIDLEIPALRRCSGIPRSLLPRKYCSDEARLATAETALEFEKTLDSGCPSFVKLMLHSHVTRGFWLGLPSVFCQGYMPNKDTVFILEDEKALEWEALYLAYKFGLSGGWRGFSIDHELEDGDAVVFELVEARRFKVYIHRADGEVAKESKAVLLNSSSTNDLACSEESPNENCHVGLKVVSDEKIHSRSEISAPSKKQKLNGENKIPKNDKKGSHKASLAKPQKDGSNDAETNPSNELLVDSNLMVVSDNLDKKTSSKSDKSNLIIPETGRLRPRRIIPHGEKIIDMLPRKKPHRQLLAAMAKA